MSQPTDYVAIFEPAADGSYSVYVPDLPGCVSTGDTMEEAEALIREAIKLYLESLVEQGEAIPPAASSAKLVHVA